MNRYLAQQISLGALDYFKVIKRFPKRKAGIDYYLVGEFHTPIPEKKKKKGIFEGLEV